MTAAVMILTLLVPIGLALITVLIPLAVLCAAVNRYVPQFEENMAAGMSGPDAAMDAVRQYHAK
jgi:hypothetical protein